MRDFTIAAAQIASIRGDLAANLAAHVHAVEQAARHRVSAVIFPELSLTGYEPDLAVSLAFDEDDGRLAPLCELAARHEMTVVAGAPIRTGHPKPLIGAFVMSASGALSVYRKMHLGSSEAPFFATGSVPHIEMVDGQRFGVAICADTSQPSHPRTYAELGARIYAAGVFLNEEWYETDTARYPRYAAQFDMLAVMANHGASVGTLTSVGKSAIWAPGGTLLVQATGTESALVMATLERGLWRGVGPVLLDRP